MEKSPPRNGLGKNFGANQVVQKMAAAVSNYVSQTSPIKRSAGRRLARLVSSQGDDSLVSVTRLRDSSPIP